MNRHTTFDTGHRRRSTTGYLSLVSVTMGAESEEPPTSEAPQALVPTLTDFLTDDVDIGVTTVVKLGKSSLGIATESHRSGELTQAPTTVVGGRRTEPYFVPQEGSLSSATQSTENESTQPSPSLLAAGSHIFQPTYNGGGHPRTMGDRMPKFATSTSARSARCARGIVMESSLSTPVIQRGRVGRLEIANTASGPAEGRHLSRNAKDPLMSVGLLSGNSGAEIIGSHRQNSEGDHEDFPLVL